MFCYLLPSEAKRPPWNGPEEPSKAPIEQERLWLEKKQAL